MRWQYRPTPFASLIYTCLSLPNTPSLFVILYKIIAIILLIKFDTDFLGLLSEILFYNKQWFSKIILNKSCLTSDIV